ncbi:MAG: Do family serine endopeptidase [Candidatus Aminicenantes bacterium]|nr:Do family serine endopeptidase [Candidatus Aminicenantes bacterium]
MKKIALIALISFFLGIFLAGMVFFYFPEKNTSESFLYEPNFSSSPAVLHASPSPQAKSDLNFVKVADKVGPSVVRITTERVEKRKATGFGDDWPFEDFWDRFFGTPRGREQEYRSEARGAGFFISSDGYVLTNNHLVENAVKVTVFSLQDKEYKAKIVGTDPRTDLALLKIDDKNLSFAELADSAQLRVGEWVLAIGNPWGLEHTVTAGIVSAKGRQLGGSMNVPEYQDYIQTDAAINRGNSGGPLVNMKGEVVGINAIILAPTGGNIGIGFAIPSNLARKIVKQLKDTGKVIRGYLGVRTGDLTEDEREALKLKTKKGAFVHEVSSGTPADKAGIKPYDVIIEIDGNPVKSSNDLKFKIAEIEPGKKINIKVIREGKERVVDAKLIELDADREQKSSAASEKDLGFSYQTLTQQIARRLGLQTKEGVLITEVTRFSEAARKELQAGDIILEANRRKVTTRRDLDNILKKLDPGDTLMLKIRRETSRETIEFIRTLRIPE